MLIHILLTLGLFVMAITSIHGLGSVIHGDLDRFFTNSNAEDHCDEQSK